MSSIGNPQGDVTFVEFFDYNCGYCKRAMTDMMDADEGRPQAQSRAQGISRARAGLAGRGEGRVAVRMQDKTGKKYLEFHQKLMTGRGQIDKARALAAAKEVGLDMARIERDLGGEEVRASIEESFKLAEKLGVNGTPSLCDRQRRRRRRRRRRGAARKDQQRPMRQSDLLIGLSLYIRLLIAAPSRGAKMLRQKATIEETPCQPSSRR